MAQDSPREVLHIKKYPNRRYYDAIHSRHVTLGELHDMIVGGQEVHITDSRTGDDITNLVLTQILLERDQPKLDIFPTAFFHLMLRSNRQLLRNWVEHVFGPFMGLLATSQKQFDAYLRQAMGGHLVTPFDWARTMMPGMVPDGHAAKDDAGRADPDRAAPASSEEEPAGEETLDELRCRVAELTRRIEELAQNNRNEDYKAL